MAEAECAVDRKRGQRQSPTGKPGCLHQPYTHWATLRSFFGPPAATRTHIATNDDGGTRLFVAGIVGAVGPA